MENVWKIQTFELSESCWAGGKQGESRTGTSLNPFLRFKSAVTASKVIVHVFKCHELDCNTENGCKQKLEHLYSWGKVML